MSAPAAHGRPLLEVEHITMRFGGLTAVNDLSFAASKGEITALIGPNGAGKTTVFNCITGFYKPTQGMITLTQDDGASYLLERMPDFRIAWRAKVARTFQNIRLFGGMTVLENLDMGAYTRKDRKSLGEDLDRVFELFPRLAERRSQAGGTLSGGEQQMLAIGRALMAKPRLLLLDEPSMGLAPQFIQQIFRIITEINSQGVTVLLVEQNAQQALQRAHRAYVIETGRITKSGTGEELLADPAIKEAYLGVA